MVTKYRWKYIKRYYLFNENLVKTTCQVCYLPVACFKG